MEFFAILALIAAALFAAVFIQHTNRQDIHKSKILALSELLKSSRIDNRHHIGADASSALGIDEPKRKIAIATHGEEAARVYPFADILAVEIVEDGRSVTKTSSSRSIGGAIVGGLIAGPAGLVVGGLGGRTTGRELRDVRAIDVVITVADMAHPRHVLRVLDAPHGLRAESRDYQAARRDAEDLLATLKAAIELADREAGAGQAATPAAPSVADELEKLAALRDKGVLTEEEFQAQKRGLLAPKSA